MATKSKLVELISNKLNYLPKDDINSAIDLILEFVKDELTKGNRIEIREFGNFSIKNRKIPKTDKSRKVIYYKMSKKITKKYSK